jgi:hypothetical protein
VRLEDALELCDQPDSISYQLVEPDFLTGMVFEPPKTFDMLWAVETVQG